MTVLSRVPLETIAWLLTFGLHSTVLFLLALLLARLCRAESVRAVLWKTALIGALATTVLQMLTGFAPVTGRLLVAERIVEPASRQNELPPGASVTTALTPVTTSNPRSDGQNLDGAPSGASGGRPFLPDVADVATDEQSIELLRERPAHRGPIRTTLVGAARWGSAILVVWMSVALLLLLRLAAGFRKLSILLRDRTPVNDPRITAMLGELVRAARLAKPLSLTVSARCQSPLVLRAREICVPARFLHEFDAEQQRVALAHEVAHIARRDRGWSLIAAALSAVFFFQPLYAVARSQLRAASEVLADDWAVEQTGSRIALARCLMRVAEWIAADGPFSTPAAVAMAESSSPLLVRVERLLGPRLHEPAPSGRRALLLAAGMLLLVAWTAPGVSCDCASAGPASGAGTSSGVALPQSVRGPGPDAVQTPVAAVFGPNSHLSQTSPEELRLMRSTTVACAALAAAATLASCSGPTRSSDVIVRDSAGIEVIENPGEPWMTQPRWALSAEPVVRIGSVATSLYQFDEIGGIAVLSNGRIVVSDRGRGSLRWFDARGRFLFERGRRGQGPGEFEAVRAVTRLAGDSVAAIDVSALRLTLFASDGALGPALKLVDPGTLPFILQRTASGIWIVGSSGGDLQHRYGPDHAPGIYRPLAPILRISPDGSRTDTLGMFPSRDLQIRADGSAVPARVAKRLSFAVFGDHVFVGTQDRLEVDVFTPDGRRVRSVRAPDVNLAVTGEVETAFRNSERSLYANSPPEVRAAAERRISEYVLPPTMPAFSSLMADEIGNLWLGEYRYDQPLPRRFLVFDPEGRFVTVVAVPERFTPLAITSDRVWGRATDSLDVEYVVGYSIVRNK